MYLIPVPALADNYLCLLHDSKHAPVADPTNAGVSRTLRNQHGLDLESILVTHPQTDREIPDSLKKPASIVGKTAATGAACKARYISNRLQPGVAASPIIYLWQSIAAPTNQFAPGSPSALLAFAATRQ
jgi:hypothetical protein